MADILVIVHLFGVILGAGGAFASDMMFFSSARDKTFSETELRFLRIGSAMVWTGLVILILSGIGLFLQDPERYLASSKFLLKMTVVGVIFINGIIFHMLHIPRLKRHMDHHYPSSDEFMRARPWLLASGAISFTSWVCAFVLGSLKSIPLTYWQAVLFYLVLLACAIAGALIIRGRVLPHHKE